MQLKILEEHQINSALFFVAQNNMQYFAPMKRIKVLHLFFHILML